MWKTQEDLLYVHAVKCISTWNAELYIGAYLVKVVDSLTVFATELLSLAFKLMN